MQATDTDSHGRKFRVVLSNNQEDGDPPRPLKYFAQWSLTSCYQSPPAEAATTTYFLLRSSISWLVLDSPSRVFSSRLWALVDVSLASLAIFSIWSASVLCLR